MDKKDWLSIYGCADDQCYEQKLAVLGENGLIAV